MKTRPIKLNMRRNISSNYSSNLFVLSLLFVQLTVLNRPSTFFEGLHSITVFFLWVLRCEDDMVKCWD